MIYLCDMCGASLVDKGMIKPRGAVFPPNKIPWKNINCSSCGVMSNCFADPDVIKEGDNFKTNPMWRFGNA